MCPFKQSTDINELKEVIEELVESREKYRNIAEMAALGLMIVQNKKITFVNQWLADLLEYSVEEIMTWNLDRANQQVNPDDLNQIQMDQETDFPNMKFRLISKTGIKYWVRQYSEKIHINGKIADQIIILNISDQINAELKLKHTAKKFREIFEFAPIGILTCDNQGQILTSNNRLLRILGSDSHEKTKQINLLNFPPLKKIGFSQKLAECIQKKIEINAETEYVSKWGVKSYVQYKLVPLVDESGKTYEILCNINDITHIKQAQDELRAKDLLFQKMFNLAPFPIMIISETGSVKFLNQKIMDILKLTDIKNLEIYDLVSMSEILVQDQFLTRENFKERWTEVLNAIKYQDYKTELTLQGNDISPIQLFCTISLIENQILFIFEDLTAKRQIEKEWLQTQKLESLNILAGGIAHDFNNILVGIVGNISLLQMSEGLDEETKSCLADLEKATNRARGLTSQLLTFSKGGKPIKKVGNLADLMEQTLQLVTPGSNCKIKYKKPANIFWADMDASQIQQVFNNLIINAMQAMPRGGNISITIEKFDSAPISTMPRTSNGYAQISISDEGQGIPKEYANRVFEPYFTTKDTGNGLGLASSYSIIRNHQGYIKFDSQLGQGTTFYVYIPLTKINLNIPLSSNENFKNYKKRALIIDDDVIVCKTMQKMLQKFGIKSDVEHDGFSAINRYEQSLKTGIPYDFTIIDLTIPGSIGGKEIIQRLIVSDPNVQALVSSGFSHNPIMANYQEYGFKDVLVKPYNLSEIQVKLKNLFTK
ncbi:ATP-binding protein [Candidatus Lokiarchaeum ossiferum]|uniref:ATP-binding protein n=1 Tax=Candidatus Lokiarchaeum ossiferum TaxID=2951803 RepID=UPI00352E5940